METASWSGGRPTNSSRRSIPVRRQAATQSSVQQSQTQERVFALTPQDGRASNSVVEGMISLSGHTAHALFDPCATHSFISSAFAYKLNQSPESLGFQLVISTPVGVEMISSTRYKNCEVMIGEVKKHT